MDKHALSAVIVLLVLAVAQGHTVSGRYLRESAGSSNTDSSGHTIVDVGDTTPDVLAIDPRNSTFDSSSSQATGTIEATSSTSSSSGSESSSPPPTSDPGRDTTSRIAVVPIITSSQSPQLSSTLNPDVFIVSVAAPETVNVDLSTSTHSPDSTIVDISTSQEANTADEVRNSLSKAEETGTPANSISEPTTVQVVTSAAVYTFSSSSVASSSPSSISSNEVSQPTTSPAPSPDQNVASYSSDTAMPTEEQAADDSTITRTASPNQGVTSYSSGTAAPTEERAAVDSAVLEFSTSPQQVEDVTTPSPSTVTAAAPSTHSTAPTSDKKATSTTDRSSTNDNDSDSDRGGTNGSSSTDPPTSYSALRSPIFYACVVLTVAGLVGAVFAFRAKRKCDDRDERLEAAESPAATPPLSRRAVWAPPISQVRVVIDDHNFAML